ncbi:MAG: hypothetical protein RLP02_12660 [Coleofasciculus sp. C2-GNP5-27]
MNTQAGIVLNLLLWGTVLSQPVIGIQPHQRFLMLPFYPQAGQDLLLTQKNVIQVDEPPLNPGSPDERIPAGTHKSNSLAVLPTRKDWVRVEEEPTPPKEQIPGGSRWIAILRNVNKHQILGVPCFLFPVPSPHHNSYSATSTST